MSFFCLLWVSVFLMFRRSLAGTEGGHIFALLFGSITAVSLFFMGDFITPGGFGLSRWIYGFVDLVSVPVLVPVFLCLITLIFKRSGEVDFTGFALFWLIPFGALRTLSWSAGRDPLLLVAVPLLWTALAAGIGFFIHLIAGGNSIAAKIGSALGILTLPVLGAFTYWAFFSQQTILGFVFFFITQIPCVMSFVVRK